MAKDGFGDVYVFYQGAVILPFPFIDYPTQN